ASTRVRSITLSPARAPGPRASALLSVIGETSVTLLPLSEVRTASQCADLTFATSWWDATSRGWMITDYARVNASWRWACRGQSAINLALCLRGGNLSLVPEITYTPPPAERVGWRAISGTAPALKGGRDDRIRGEDRGSHRRRQRNGPRVGPPAGGGSLQCRNVRRF